MMLISTYLAPSAIEGLGVFTAERLTRGQHLWSMDPRFDLFLHESELVALPPQMRDFMARYSYPHIEKPGVVVFNSDNGRFMNHTLTPNTDFRSFNEGYALTDIEAGEELTCNYHEFIPAFTGFSTEANGPGMQAHLQIGGLNAPEQPIFPVSI